MRDEASAFTPQRDIARRSNKRATSQLSPRNISGRCQHAIYYFIDVYFGEKR